MLAATCPERYIFVQPPRPDVRIPHRVNRRLTLAAAIALFLAVCGTGEARESPADATVLIRVRGNARLEVTVVAGTAPQVRELRNIEIGTGSGFVVSADGYIVTNQHVIAGGTIPLNRPGQNGQLTLEVQQIEVQFPPDASAAPGVQRRYTATVVAADATLDLAILYLNSSGLPYAARMNSPALK